MSQFLQSGRKIIVATQLDSGAAELLKQIGALSQLLAMPVHVVHVVEPWVGALGFGAIPLPDVSEVIQQQMLSDAKQKLQEAISKSGILASSAVVLGPVVEALCEQAKALQAGLIVCGRTISEQSFLPAGFSTAIGLMSAAPCPSLIVPSGVSLDWTRSQFVLADDLSETSKEAMQFGAGLAQKCRAALLHVHALDLRTEDLQSTIDTALATARSQARVDATSFVASMRSSICEQMKKRVGQVEAPYETRILDGKPGPAMGELLKSTKNAVAVFGRHKTFHIKPLAFGQMPFKVALSSHVPVVVVPG